MTETIEKKLPSLNTQFDVVCKKMNAAGASKQVNAHIRAVSNRPNIALFHADPSIEAALKSDVYVKLLSCILNNDYSKLSGQDTMGKGDKRVDPADEATPATTPEPPRTTAPASSVPKVTPNPEPVKRGTGAIIEPDTEDDALQLQRILKRLSGGGKAEIDQEQVENIVNNRIAMFEEGELGDKIKKHLSNGAFPVDRVKELFKEFSKDIGVQRIELVHPSGDVKAITGLVHKDFKTILAMTRSRNGNGFPVPVWLDGPPGGGKSHIMEQVAEALELSAYILAIGPTDTKSAIIGSVATGEFKPGIAYEPYKNGGVLGIDEIAAGDPGVLVSTNSLVANNNYRFPNGELVKKHKNFHVIVADNTRGNGSSKGMIRNRLDAATLDRFAFLHVDYDKQLESALCGNAKWAEYVNKIREYVASNSSESIYITPRASINGAALLAGGVDVNTVCNATVFKSCSKDLKATIVTNVGVFKQ